MITLELPPEEERILNEAAARRLQSPASYAEALLKAALRTLQAEEQPQAFAPGPELAAEMKRAKQQLRKRIKSEPRLAAVLNQPTQEAPEDGILEAAYAGVFGDQVVEEVYGEELADQLRRRLGG